MPINEQQLRNLILLMLARNNYSPSMLEGVYNQYVDYFNQGGNIKSALYQLFGGDTSNDAEVQGILAGTDTGGGTTPPPGDIGVPDEGITPGETGIRDPYAEYLNMIGLGGRTAFTPTQAYKAAQFNPLMELYEARTRFGEGLSPENPFAALAYTGGGGLGGFYKGNPQFGLDPYSVATNRRGIFRTMMNASPDQRSEAGYTYQMTPNEEGGAPYYTGLTQDQIAELRGFLEAGSTPGSRRPGYYLGQRLGPEQAAWRSSLAGGQTQQTSFLDYLKNKYASIFSRY